MKKFIKGYGLFVFFFIIFTVLVLKNISRDIKIQKYILWNSKIIHDSRLHGWWKEIGHNGNYMFLDTATNKKYFYHIREKYFSINYWYTYDGILYETYNQRFPNGSCEYTNDKYKPLHTRIDTYKRIPYSILFDSLKQYKFLEDTILGIVK